MKELCCLLMSVRLLQSAVQSNFEMEISQRRSELRALEGCERETNDSISSYCEANLTQHFPTPDFQYIHTQVHTHIHKQMCTDRIRNNTPNP